MEENGVFTTLVTINIGVLALISTFLLATHFFYNDKKNNTVINIKKSINKIINTKTQVDKFRKRDKVSFEELKKLLDKTIDGCETDKNTKSTADLIFETYEEIYFFLIYQDYINENILFKKKPSDLQEIISNIEQLEFYIKTVSNSKVFSDIINTLEHYKKNAILEIRDYISLEIEKALDRKNSFENTIDLVYEYNSLTQHERETRPKKIFYLLISMPIIFGIIAPLFSISIFPYNTYIEGFKYDLSKAVAFALTILSLSPYGNCD